MLECEAAHDFRYVGVLAGSALKPKATAPLLREGKAWGRAVAALHANDHDLGHARIILTIALELDAQEQRDAGLYIAEDHEATFDRLDAMLVQYGQTVEHLPITTPERELEVAIPSRTGRRRSNLYRLQCFIDGIHTDADGRKFIVEFKLRKQLSSYQQVVLSRQTRWYGWAYEQTTGEPITGVIVDERLNAVPSPVKLNKDGSPSKVQTCTVAAYVATCEEMRLEPVPEVLTGLEAKQWQIRHPRLMFRPAEITEAGLQLVSAASQIHDLETGRYPIRNPSQMRCPRCAYKEICPNPHDSELVDALFERVLPKKDRGHPVDDTQRKIAAVDKEVLSAP